MTLKFFQFPNCIQQTNTMYAFSDICTSGYGSSSDLALTACDIDKKGNGTITASFFNHPSEPYVPPMCNNSIQYNLTSTGWGVCTNIGSSSFIFGDESEEIQCASSQTQGAVLVSSPGAAQVCAALQYTITTSIPITGRNGCTTSYGQPFQASYLNKKQKAVSLTYFTAIPNGNPCINTSIIYSWPIMPLDGSCVNSTGNQVYVSGALPCIPYNPQ